MKAKNGLNIFILLLLAAGAAYGIFHIHDMSAPFSTPATQSKQVAPDSNTFFSQGARSKAQMLSDIQLAIVDYMSKEDAVYRHANQETLLDAQLPIPKKSRTSYRNTDIQKSKLSYRIIVKLKASNPQLRSGVPGKILAEDPFSQIQQRYTVQQIQKVFPSKAIASSRLLSPSAIRGVALTSDIDRLYTLKVHLPSDQSLVQFLDFCNQVPNIEYAEPDYPIVAHSFPDDPLFDLQWHLHNTGQDYPSSGNYNLPPGLTDVDIDAPEVWNVIADCNDVIIAVIDTGVDYTHPDLADNMWINQAEMNGNAGIDDDENGYIDDIYGINIVDPSEGPKDDNGHGTHCAGIIAAVGDNATDISGVCWSAQIMALKFLDRYGSGSSLDSIEAIVYAVQNGAKIISNSYGGSGRSQAVQDAIDYAVASGVVFVASAGNDGTDSPLYPAANNSVLSVAATDSTDQRAVFSSYGNWVDLAAPGVDILSLRGKGTSLGTPYNDTTTILSGTSMACPVVAGTCGLLTALNPALTSDQIQLLLFSSLDPLNETFTAHNGRINARSAVAALFGQVRFGQSQYTCSSDVDVWVADLDLANQGAVSVMLQSDTGDIESFMLAEATFGSGFFIGSIPAASGPAVLNDGMLQMLHNQVITATYSDEKDINGQPKLLADAAIVDCQGPALLDMEIQAPGSVVTIHIITDEPAKLMIDYGLACGDLSTGQLQSEQLSTEHVIKIRNVLPETTYYVAIRSEDALGNISLYDNGGQCFTFTTTSILGDLHVPADFPTIQAAVDRAWDSDTVRLADGTYSGPGNMNIRFDGKQLTVMSVNGPENCIIDCDSSSRGFILNDDPNAVIEGLTIMRGYSKTNVNGHIREYLEGGSGIYAFQSNLTVKNCVFQDNYARGYGGAIYVDGGTTQIYDSIFMGGEAVAGGAVSVEGFFQPAEVILDGCLIADNQTELYGGGVDFRNASVTASNCIIRDNSVSNTVLQSRGGGVYAGFDSEGVLSNCTISDNNADVGGGVSSVSSRMLQMVQCQIERNSAVYGGGIFVSDCNAILSNSLILDNKADEGAGLMQWDAVSANIENCTFTRNIAAQTAGGIANINDSSSILLNSILWANAPESEQIYLNKDPERPNRMNVHYSNIQGGLSGIYDPNGSALWGEGNIDLDPLFAFPADAHLLPESPCIDRGAAKVNMWQLGDLDGGYRTIDGDMDGQARMDLGCYEYDPAKLVLTVSKTYLEFQATAGGEVGPSAILQLTVPGGGPLNWQIFSSVDWIQVIPEQGVLDGQMTDIQIQIDPSSLTGGDYFTELTVVAPDAVNSPRKIKVNLQLSGTLHVPAQYSTIQTAIDAARDGDTILVADGTYRGQGNRDIHFDGKAIHLKSESGPLNCILDVQGSETDPHRAFAFFNSAETNQSIIEGFTLTGGYVSENYFKIFPPFNGGAVFCGSSNPVFRQCIFSNNSAYDSGGAAYFVVLSILLTDHTRVERCLFLNNLAEGSFENQSGGGAVYINDLFEMENCVVARNETLGDGGGIWLAGANQHIINCTVVGNQSQYKGGGMYLWNGFQDFNLPLPQYVELNNSIFRDNHAEVGNEIAGDYEEYEIADVYNAINTPPKMKVQYSSIPGQDDDLYLHPGTEWIKQGQIQDVDPIFLDPNHGDYHLSTISPLIDKGSNELISGTLDLDGNPRFLDADYDGLPQVDLGAFEFWPAVYSSPLIEISQWEYDFVAYEREQNPPVQTFRIRNSGINSFQWQITGGCSWLTVTPESGASSGQSIEVTLQPDITGLTRGLHTCQLTVEAPSAANHPRTFTVNLRIFKRGELFVPDEFPTIQQAINMASEGDHITIAPGSYDENIYIFKDITLQSTNPDNWDIVSNTIIKGTGSNPVVTFSGDEENASLSGLTITGGYTVDSGGGIQGSQAYVEIQKCIIRDNVATDSGGGIHAIRGPIRDCRIEYNVAQAGGGLADCNEINNCVIASNAASQGGGLDGCNDTIIHCTIVDNMADHGAALSRCSGSIRNCIIWANMPDAMYQSSTPVYSCVEGFSSGLGNLNIDPEFIEPNSGDYRLTPGSLCIDAAVQDEMQPVQVDIDGTPRPIDGNNDGLVAPDMGAYEMPISDEPIIGISQAEFVFTSLGPNTQTIRIWNAGIPPVTYTIADPNCFWLDVSPTTGTVSDGVADVITLTVNTNQVPPGSYECQLFILDPMSLNSPRTVDVRLRVFKDTIILTSAGPTIQYALEYVTEGGTIILDDGIYTGPGNQDVDFSGRAATVKSANGPDHCIIDLAADPNHPHRAFVFQNNEGSDSILNGLTITNGYTVDPGAAVFCDRSSPIILNCRFRNNVSAADAGGAVYCYQGETVIEKSIFQANAALHGGAVANQEGQLRLTENAFLANSAILGGAVYNRSGSVLIQDCIFTQNSAEDGGALYNDRVDGVIADCTFMQNCTTFDFWFHGGGAVFNRRSNLSITGCHFIANRSAWDGGAVENNESSPHIEDCSFTDNQALGNDGGAVFNFAGSDPNIAQCIFNANYAKSWGGAIRNRQSSPRIENTLFVDNTAVDNGGAIFNFSQSNPLLIHCTFIQNSANTNDGGAMYSLTECEPKVINSIFWDNELTQVFDSDAVTTITFSNIDWPGSGNIQLPPQFRDPNEGDFRLDRLSPCIDGGKGAALYRDLDGHPRPWDAPWAPDADLGAYDMGCYEFSPVVGSLKINPQSINTRSKGKSVRLTFFFPDGITPKALDATRPVLVHTEQSVAEVKRYSLSVHKGQYVMETELENELFKTLGEDSTPVSITVYLIDGRILAGTDTIRIKSF